MTVTLVQLKSKNWEGDNSWRRCELNTYASELNLKLDPEDSNENVYNKIKNKLSEFIFELNNPVTSLNVAAFDFDHTIVKPKNARTFPKDKNDWMWLRPCVPLIIKEKAESGYSIFIFTTQTKEWKLEMLKECLGTLNIPLTIVVGFKENIKKPNKNLFYNVISDFDNENSFYVGDASGMEGSWSDSDKQFAENVGIKFMTPEQIFPINVNFKIDDNIYTKSNQEIVIMIGYMASGKSTFVKNKLFSYTRIDGDLLKTTPKMVKVAIPFIEKGESVVFDSTNGKLKNRQLIYDLAKKYNVPVRCIIIDTTIEQAMEFNELRALETGKKNF